ncbi:MAG: ATP synthase subunit C [Tissierellia bacterium]|nr:ATP synthase subunit C [Tissierellia bacterium]
MEKILIGALLFVLMMISGGMYGVYKNTETSRKMLRFLLRLHLFILVPVIVFTIITIVPEFVHAQGQGDSGSGLGYLAAGLSTGLASLGAGVAVANVGSSAIGAVSEDPRILGKSMIFLGLAEGIAIYGLIISIMILGKL